MSVTPRKSNEFKLVIAGLDNACKSSALIALRQKYNFYERVIKIELEKLRNVLQTSFT